MPAYLGGVDLALRQCADYGSPVVRELLRAENYRPGGTGHQGILDARVPMAVQMEGAFAELVEAAGGIAALEGAGMPGELAQIGQGSREGGVRVQRQAMGVIERRVATELDAACRGRGAWNDPSKHAFMEACAWSGILFSASPTRQDCLPTPLYMARVAYLLGRIPTRFVPVLGMPVGRMTVGAEGTELLTANPRDCNVTRTHVHDQVTRRLIQKWREYVGPTCARDERAAASWFSTCVPAAGRAEYGQLRRSTRESGTAGAQPQVMRGDGVLAGGMAQCCRSADARGRPPGGQDGLL